MGRRPQPTKKHRLAAAKKAAEAAAKKAAEAAAKKAGETAAKAHVQAGVTRATRSSSRIPDTEQPIELLDSSPEKIDDDNESTEDRPNEYDETDPVAFQKAGLIVVGCIRPPPEEVFTHKPFLLLREAAAKVFMDMILNEAACEFLASLRDNIDTVKHAETYTYKFCCVQSPSICVPLLNATKKILPSHILDDIGRMKVPAKPKKELYMFTDEITSLADRRCHLFWFRPNMGAAPN
jgi:hypothetical protein